MSATTASTEPSFAASSEPTAANLQHFLYLVLAYPPGELPIGLDAPPEAFPGGFSDTPCQFASRPPEIDDLHLLHDRVWAIAEVQTYLPVAHSPHPTTAVHLAFCASEGGVVVKRQADPREIACIPVLQDGSVGLCSDGAPRTGGTPYPQEVPRLLNRSHKIGN